MANVKTEKNAGTVMYSVNIVIITIKYSLNDPVDLILVRCRVKK